MEVRIMKNICKLKGLDCANCAAKLEEAIQKIEGIESASVSFMTQRLVFECKEEEKAEILEKVKKVVKKEEPDVKLEEM